MAGSAPELMEGLVLVAQDASMREECVRPDCPFCHPLAAALAEADEMAVASEAAREWFANEARKRWGGEE